MQVFGALLPYSAQGPFLGRSAQRARETLGVPYLAQHAAEQVLQLRGDRHVFREAQRLCLHHLQQQRSACWKLARLSVRTNTFTHP